MYRILFNHLLGAVLVLLVAAATGGQEKQKTPDYYPLAKGTQFPLSGTAYLYLGWTLPYSPPRP